MNEDLLEEKKRINHLFELKTKNNVGSVSLFHVNLDGSTQMVH